MTAPYYQDASVTIFHGNCREIAPSLSAVDALISDPPYGEQTHEGARGGDYGENVLVDFAPTTAAELRETLARFTVRRWAVLFCEWKFIAALEREPPCGMEFVRFGVWVKPNGAPQFTGDRPAMGWEAIAILHAPGRKRWNGGGRHATWTTPRVNGEHPTQKPLALVRDLVSLFTDAGEMVLDPFMGSGTTLRAAKDLGRRAIGIEIEERYCEIAAKRMLQESLFEAAPVEPVAVQESFT